MKLIILLILVAVFVLGCATPSTITFNEKGKVTSASNYTITEKNAAYVPYIPDNWFTSAMKQMMEAIAPYLGAFTDFFGGGKAIIPAPVR